MLKIAGFYQSDCNLEIHKNAKKWAKNNQTALFYAKNGFKVARLQRVLDRLNIFIKNRTEKTVSAVFFFSIFW